MATAAITAIGRITMPRTAARFTQAEAVRAIRAAKAEGALAVEVEGGTIRIVLAQPDRPARPSTERRAGMAGARPKVVL